MCHPDPAFIIVYRCISAILSADAVGTKPATGASYSRSLDARTIARVAAIAGSSIVVAKPCSAAPDHPTSSVCESYKIYMTAKKALAAVCVWTCKAKGGMDPLVSHSPPVPQLETATK
jgi:hypothetical protein